jgi:hypothetical protein
MAPCWGSCSGAAIWTTAKAALRHAGAGPGWPQQRSGLRRYRDPVIKSYIRNGLLPAPELFASAYLQYIAQKSGDARLLAGLRAEFKMRVVRQWPAEEFAAIAAELENVLGQLK